MLFLLDRIYLAESGGFFQFLGNAMGTLLMYAYNFTNNWGLAIILLTVVIKMLLFPTAVKQAKSMQDMHKIQPEIKKIQEKYKDDKQTQQQKMMEIYKEHNVNPFSSCLPLLIQFPILIAFFQGIMRLEALKGANFLWIADLGSRDIPLAVLTGISMFLQTFLQQKWSGAPTTPQMQTMNMVFPFMIIFFGLSMPSGVLVYWFTSQLILLGQQYFIHRYLIPPVPATHSTGKQEKVEVVKPAPANKSKGGK